jgi:hypothetical protein
VLAPGLWFPGYDDLLDLVWFPYLLLATLLPLQMLLMHLSKNLHEYKKDV